MSLIAKLPHNEQPHYMVQLDALRALAVFGVLVHHFLPQEFFLNSKLHWGPLAVRLFFVLSGFLITGILLRCRELIDSTSKFGRNEICFKYCSYRNRGNFIMALF